jgi:hypothetical protein
MTSRNEKNTNENSWDGLIDEAMDEISNENSSINNSYHLPKPFFYFSLIGFVFSLFFNWPQFSDTHADPSSTALQSGQRIALLAVADDVIAYKLKNGTFPEELPSLLSSIIQIKYRKITNTHFELKTPILGGDLVLEHTGNNDHIYKHTE